MDGLEGGYDGAPTRCARGENERSGVEAVEAE